VASCRSHNRSVASAVTALPKATRICAMQRHVQCYNVTTSQRYSAASCPMLQCYNVTTLQCSIMSNVTMLQRHVTVQHHVQCWTVSEAAQLTEFLTFHDESEMTVQLQHKAERRTISK